MLVYHRCVVVFLLVRIFFFSLTYTFTHSMIKFFFSERNDETSTSFSRSLDTQRCASQYHFNRMFFFNCFCSLLYSWAKRYRFIRVLWWCLRREKENRRKKKTTIRFNDIHRFYVHLSFLIVGTITLRWWVHTMSKYSIQTRRWKLNWWIKNKEIREE